MQDLLRTVSSGFACVRPFCLRTKILWQREGEVNQRRTPGRTTVQVALVRQMCTLSDLLPPTHVGTILKNDSGVGTCPYSQACVWTLLAGTGAGLAWRSADNSCADFVVVLVDVVPQLLVCPHLFNDKVLPGSTPTS